MDCAGRLGPLLSSASPPAQQLAAVAVRGNSYGRARVPKVAVPLADRRGVAGGRNQAEVAMGEAKVGVKEAAAGRTLRRNAGAQLVPSCV